MREKAARMRQIQRAESLGAKDAAKAVDALNRANDTGKIVQIFVGLEEESGILDDKGFEALQSMLVDDLQIAIDAMGDAMSPAEHKWAQAILDKYK